tara:strand:+ start:75 stop:2156 length:2082 start_codon:yes stop_codon:yes gene_type:complete
VEGFERAWKGPVTDGFSAGISAPFGSWGPSVLASRVQHLVSNGVSPYTILVLVGNRSRRRRFYRELDKKGLATSQAEAVELQTYNGLASQTVRLFWPQFAADAGFSASAVVRPPVMLTFETAQYLMLQLVNPLIQQGYFEGLSIRRQRVLSQLLDNLNKAAVNGFPKEQVIVRLQEAWAGEQSHQVYFQQGQECIEKFRAHCLENGLVDFSLVVELFNRYFVQANQDVDKEPFGRFRHLIADQLEETVPVAQDFVKKMMVQCESTLLICDCEGGYRVFMGVDSMGAERLISQCQEVVTAQSEAEETPLVQLAEKISTHIGGENRFPTPRAYEAIAGSIFTRYRAEMIDGVVQNIAKLVGGGVDPSDIAAIAPHADGVLRFLMTEALESAGIPFVVVRRYESLREDPKVRTCLTLAAIGHPEWEYRPHPYDVAEAIAMVTELDLIRATLAARHLYDPVTGELRSAQGLEEGIVKRIGHSKIEQWEIVRHWLQDSNQVDSQNIDHFFRKLFGNVLAKRSIKPEEAAVYARLIRSATWFRQAVPLMGLENKIDGRRYIDMLSEGIVSADYQTQIEDVVDTGAVMLVAPVYTYLLHEHVSRYQFWLDVGSIFWWEPPHQPLTNPHVLSRSWQRGKRWEDTEDFEHRNQLLQRLIRGLCRRCRDGVFVCGSEVDSVSGCPQDSPLLQALDRLTIEANV